MLHDVRIVIDGPVGYYCGGMSDGVRLEIHGSAGWGAAECLLSGSVVIDGNAGNGAAASIRGGTVVVKGDAAARAGIAMKGGLLVIGGDTGYMTGFMMQRGRIIVCGNAAVSRALPALSRADPGRSRDRARAPGRAGTPRACEPIRGAGSRARPGTARARHARGVSDARSIECLQVRQRSTGPFLVCFSTMNGAPQLGHVTGRGRSHTANVQSGYREHG